VNRMLPPPPPQKGERPQGSPLARAGFKTLKFAGLALVRLLLGVVFRGFKSSGAYKEAVSRARSHPDVRRELGNPIQAGWWVSGSLAVNGPSGHASFATPLYGSTGRGMLYVQARKVSDRWLFDRLEVGVEGSSAPIRLLDPPTREAEYRITE
jgi:hypothetical protein